MGKNKFEKQELTNLNKQVNCMRKKFLLVKLNEKKLFLTVQKLNFLDKNHFHK